MSATLTTLEEPAPHEPSPDDTDPLKLTKLKLTGRQRAEFRLQSKKSNIECVCDDRDEWEADERMRVVLWILVLVILYFILISLGVRDLFALGISLILTGGILITDRESQLLAVALVTGVIGTLFVFAELLH